ncbi:unnamed protein product [Adineta ricciae]|uniref:Uncharacterized protein n=1 Tax=Adineta ricciae TaxID=249248 RepID=A0A813ZTX0_ADIRI|nr:unnamed protein product [Adineta ricciae]
MNNTLHSDSSYAESIEPNEDLNSSDEQQGQQESGRSAAAAPVGHAGLPAQHIQTNNPIQTGGSNNNTTASPFVFDNHFTMYPMHCMSSPRLRFPLKRLNQTRERRSKQLRSRRYSKLGKNISSLNWLTNKSY